MGKLLLHSPALAVCAIAMSTAMLAPALVEVFPDAGDVSAVRYRDGELRSIDRYLEQDAANMDVEGKAALEGMRDALSGFVYAPTPAEGFRSLATYERARGELGAADATLLQSIGIEPETPSRAEARALLLESIASLPDPKVYELSTKMPPLILLSYLQAALPSLFWLLPVVVTSLACTYLRCRSLLVFQVPATAHVRFLTAVALSLLLGLALLLVSMVPAAVVSLIKNGAGGSEYPVALIRAGASTTSMVGEAVLCSIPLLVMAYGVISVVAALTAAISRNPVVTGMVCAVLLVLGSLSAHVESVGMGVALLAPFASFDPASQVGTIGFLGRGTNAMPFGEVVGASVFLKALSLRKKDQPPTDPRSSGARKRCLRSCDRLQRNHRLQVQYLKASRQTSQQCWTDRFRQESLKAPESGWRRFLHGQEASACRYDTH